MLWSELKDRYLEHLQLDDDVEDDTDDGDDLEDDDDDLEESDGAQPARRKRKAGERHAHYERARDILGMFQRLMDPQYFADVNSDLLDRYFAKRKKQRGRKRNAEGKRKRLSASTLNGDTRYLKGILTFATRRYPKSKLGIDDDWLFPIFKRFKEKRRIKKPMEIDRIERFLVACDEARSPHQETCTPGDFWRALFLVGYSTGVRCRGLLMMLRPTDEQLETGLIFIPPEADKSSSERLRVLIPPAIEAIRRLNVQPGQKMFPLPYGIRHFYRVLHKLQEKAGIPCGDHVLPHDMRRTYATQLFKLGTAAPAVQNLMGHEDLKTTMGYVGDLSNEEMAAVRKLPQPKLSKQKSPQREFAFSEDG